MPQAPLCRFIQCLELAKEFDERYSPNMHQTDWLFEHWSFDDTAAYYEPTPPLETPPAYGPYTSWWWRELARN
jgi:hypothetical protein